MIFCVFMFGGKHLVAHSNIKSCCRCLTKYPVADQRRNINLAQHPKSIWILSPQSALRTIEVSLLSKVKFEEKSARNMQ